VQIENDGALKIIERYDAPTTLFYLDPPYLPETRSERWGQAAYFYEMTHEDHIALGERLKQIQGMAVISGYSSPLYCEMFSGWRRVTWSTLTDAATQATECLWISPAAEARGQMRLGLVHAGGGRGRQEEATGAG
jgi:DNA adenine methylase